MIKFKVDRTIKLANGETVPAGVEVQIFVERKRPTFAKLYYSPVGDIRINCANLWRYFDDFIKPTEDAITDALCDGVCPSIFQGVDIEPDGWDSDGFPSLLLALGMI